MTDALVVPSARLTDVVSELRDFAITSFDVDVDALARHLPTGLEPERLVLDDGRERALVSAVTFRNLDFRVGFAPFVRFDAPQTNFRAYVRHRGEPAVFFFGTSFGSRFVALPRWVWGLPWRYARHAIDCDFDGDGRCRRYSFHAHGAHGEEHVEASGTGVRRDRLDGFVDAAATARVLADPAVGFARVRFGGVATYGVDHAPLVLELAEPRVARFELFERLGLVPRALRPHSMLVSASSRFVVRLPPRRVRL